jgi:hypothetical protein
VGFLALATAASFGWMFWLSTGDVSTARLYFGTDTRAGELLVGGLLAVVLARGAATKTAAPQVIAGWDLRERRLPEWDETKIIGDAVFDEWLVDQYVSTADLFTELGGDVVWLTTTPCFISPEGFTEGTWDPARQALVGRRVPSLELRACCASRWAPCPCVGVGPIACRLAPFRFPTTALRSGLPKPSAP